MRKLDFRSCVFVLGVIGLAGCGSVNSGDSEANVGAAEQPLDNVTGSSPGYPSVGVSYDQVTTSLNNTYGDWDHFGIISPRWFQSYGSAGSGAGFYGMNCDYNSWPYRDFLRGISVRGDSYGHSAYCVRKANGLNFFHVSGAAGDGETKYLSRVAFAGSTTNIDDRSGSDVYWDWDWGNVKAECRWHYAAIGVVQIETGEVDAIRCQKVQDGFISSVSQGTCEVLPVDMFNNHCPGNNCSGTNDWAVNYLKNTCRDNQYIKGISKRTDGKIKSILCCPF